MIKYLGSKRLLVDDIVQIVKSFPEAQSVFDVFAGTSRVGHALKKAGYQVVANDHNAYAHCLATTYVQADRQEHLIEASDLVSKYNALPGARGYFTDNFCEQARFFQPKNGERIDAIRDKIDRDQLSPELKAIMLTSLMEAADRVDSTTGVQMAYLKQWAKRSSNDLVLRVPELLPGKGLALQLEAEDAAREVTADIAYLDPPYNQHSYLGNYHVWESLVTWDQPEVYGIARKRLDCRTRKSSFNSKARFLNSMQSLVNALQAKTLIVSFSDEGFLTPNELENILSVKGEVLTLSRDYKRYVGAQIGQFNPQGLRVASASHLRNRELIFVAGENLPKIQLRAA